MMISRKLNKTTKSLEDSALTQGSHSTSSSSDTSLHSIQTLQSLLNSKLKLHLIRLLQSQQYTKKVLLSLILSIFQKTLKKILKFWDLESKKKKRFLNGLSILQKQEKKKAESQKKQRFKQNGLEEIQQERALNSLNRIIKRKKFDFKGEVFKALIENWYFYSKIFDSFKCKTSDKVGRIVREWKRYVELKKNRKVKGVRLIREIGMRKLMVWFKGIIEKDLREEKIRKRLACFKVGKIVFLRILKIFTELKGYRKEEIDFKVNLINEVFLKLRKNLLKFGFCSIKFFFYKYTSKKSNQATQILKTLAFKKCFNVFCSLILATETNVLNKFPYLIQILKNIEEKTKRFAMIKLKNTRFSKLYLFPTKVILNKIQNLLKNHLKKAFLSLKRHRDFIKHLLSLQILSYLTTERQKALKKYSFKTLKVYINHKKQQFILWKMKFYQLEGLIQHKKEEISLKLRFKHFLQWKNTSLLLSKHLKKQVKRQAQIFTLTLSSLIQNFTLFNLSSTFLIIKQRYIQEKGILWRLEKMSLRRLKAKYFEKMRMRTLSMLTSPKSMRKSVFTYGASQRRSSPYNIASRMSSPSFPKAKGTALTRFAFYSTKKSSLDSAAYKHSGMVKMLKMIDKSSNLNNFEEFLK